MNMGMGNDKILNHEKEVIWISSFHNNQTWPGGTIESLDIDSNIRPHN